ncbi:MAG: sulfatase-like hydrolase/transferase, partial [Litorilinea sp.]
RSVLAGRMHVRGPDQLHGYAARLVGDHMPNHLGGSPADMGVLRGTETPVRKTLATSGPGQLAYQLHDEEVTAAAVGFLDRVGRERRAGLTPSPFSLTVGFMLPHPPYVPRRDAFARYRSRVTLPRKPRAMDAETHPYLRRWRTHTGSETVSEEEALNTRAAYWALVAQVDTMVGQILAALHANGLGDETVVIYTSDHGDMMGEHGLWWKHTFYEESVRVPLLIAWPGVIAPSTRCGRVVSALDVNATILDALGAPALPNSPGRSLLGLITQRTAGAGRGSPEWEDLAFAEYCEDQYSPPGGAYQRMVRRGRWKLIDYHTDPPQLFDLETDPDELVDRAADPDCVAILHELRALVRQEWDPERIRAQMAAMEADNRILEAWAGQIQPADQFRWAARAEMNSLDNAPREPSA